MYDSSMCITGLYLTLVLEYLSEHLVCSNEFSFEEKIYFEAKCLSSLKPLKLECVISIKIKKQAAG